MLSTEERLPHRASRILNMRRLHDFCSIERVSILQGRDSCEFNCVGAPHQIFQVGHELVHNLGLLLDLSVIFFAPAFVQDDGRPGVGNLILQILTLSDFVAGPVRLLPSRVVSQWYRSASCIQTQPALPIGISQCVAWRTVQGDLVGRERRQLRLLFGYDALEQEWVKPPQGKMVLGKVIFATLGVRVGVLGDEGVIGEELFVDIGWSIGCRFISSPHSRL